MSATKFWYRRSAVDLLDAHFAKEMTRSGDGTVVSVCGARFQPLFVLTTHPGEPPDPRVCADCQARAAA